MLTEVHDSQQYWRKTNHDACEEKNFLGGDEAL